MEKFIYNIGTEELKRLIDASGASSLAIVFNEKDKVLTLHCVDDNDVISLVNSYRLVASKRRNV